MCIFSDYSLGLNGDSNDNNSFAAPMSLKSHISTVYCGNWNSTSTARINLWEFTHQWSEFRRWRWKNILTNLSAQNGWSSISISLVMGQILTAGLQILRKHHPDAHPNPNPVKLLSQELLALKMVPIMDILNQFTKTMEVQHYPKTSDRGINSIQNPSNLQVLDQLQGKDLINQSLINIKLVPKIITLLADRRMVFSSF